MTSSDKSHAAIVSANKIFMEKFRQGDAAGLAGLYTANSQMLVSNLDFVAGSGAIQATWQALMDLGIKTVTLDTIEVEAFGDTAYEVGKYTLQDADGHTLDQGKYIVIWKQESGQWKLHRDIFNTSMPAKK